MQNGISMIKRVESGMKLLGSLFLVFLIFSCAIEPQTIKLHGETMGTTYSIKIFPGKDQSFQNQTLKSEIDELLFKINMQMSTYIPESEISKFNRSGKNVETPVSAAFLEVFNLAWQVNSESNGAFDPTVMPAVNLWGFGNDGRRGSPPSKKEISALIRFIGMDKIVNRENTLSKKNDKTELDFSAIAKGYGVDAIAGLIVSHGYENFMVEVGGEVVTKGKKEDGSLWLIGIERPDFQPTVERQYEAKIALSNAAVATSGDYRNYFISEDSLFSHTINPVTCRPIVNGVASVTVIAANCALADAMATAIMVMGETKGLEWVESKPQIETMIIVRLADRYRITVSSGFDAYLVKPN